MQKRTKEQKAYGHWGTEWWAVPGCRLEAARGENPYSPLLWDMVAKKQTRIKQNSYLSTMRRIKSNGKIIHNQEPCPCGTQQTAYHGMLSPRRKPTAPGVLSLQLPLSSISKDRKYLLYYRRSRSTGLACELLISVRYGKSSQGSFPLKLLGLFVCFIRWIIFCPLGLIPKSLRR